MGRVGEKIFTTVISTIITVVIISAVGSFSLDRGDIIHWLGGVTQEDLNKLANKGLKLKASGYIDGSKRFHTSGVIIDKIEQEIRFDNTGLVIITANVRGYQHNDKPQANKRYGKVEAIILINENEVSRDQSGIRGMSKVSMAASTTYVAMLPAGAYKIEARGIYQGVQSDSHPTLNMSYVVLGDGHFDS